MQDQKIIYKAVDDLIFDPLNPRLPTSYRTSDESEVLKYMISREHIFDLMGSIGEQGYFPGEPLLVVESQKNTGKYEVVEGNRRLAALRLLLHPDLAPIKKGTVLEFSQEAGVTIPTQVPVIQYPNREAILDYLGYRHITGIDQWDSLAKARYLHELMLRHEAKGLSGEGLYKHLAKIIGSRSDYVKKLLKGFEYYEIIEEDSFFNIPNLNEESFNFSLLTTATSYKNISNYLYAELDSATQAISKDRIEEVVTWMFKENAEGQKRVPESRALRTLNAVIGSPKALLHFKSGRPLSEASIFTDEPLEIYEMLINDAYDKLRYAQESLNQVSSLTNNHETRMKEIWNLSKNILGIIRIQLDSDGDIL